MSKQKWAIRNPENPKYFWGVWGWQPTGYFKFNSKKTAKKIAALYGGEVWPVN